MAAGRIMDTGSFVIYKIYNAKISIDIVIAQYSLAIVLLVERGVYE